VPLFIQVSQLQRWLSSQFDWMSFLKAPLQQRIALQRIYQTAGNQEEFNLFNCEWLYNMILNNLRIFSQNIRKNNLIIKTILEVNNNFNIIFIQEPSWTTIKSIPSSVDSEGVPLVGVVNHSNWLTFAREPDMTKECPKVTIFINIRLISFCFSFRKNIIDHRDILLASFFINSKLFWIMNVYSDSSHSAIKYLKNTEINIHNLLVMTRDFNICNSL